MRKGRGCRHPVRVRSCCGVCSPWLKPWALCPVPLRDLIEQKNSPIGSPDGHFPVTDRNRGIRNNRVSVGFGFLGGSVFFGGGGERVCRGGDGGGIWVGWVPGRRSFLPGLRSFLSCPSLWCPGLSGRRGKERVDGVGVRGMRKSDCGMRSWRGRRSDRQGVTPFQGSEAWGAPRNQGVALG